MESHGRGRPMPPMEQRGVDQLRWHLHIFRLTTAARLLSCLNLLVHSCPFSGDPLHPVKQLQAEIDELPLFV